MCVINKIYEIGVINIVGIMNILGVIVIILTLFRKSNAEKIKTFIITDLNNEENVKIARRSKNLIINSEVLVIRESQFANCKNLKTLKIYAEDLIIKENAFQNCRKLKKVILKGKISIGNYAFAGCEKLDSVKYSENTTYSNENIFADSKFGKKIKKQKFKQNKKASKSCAK